VYQSAFVSIVFPLSALRRESLLQLVHRPFLDVGFDLDVALWGQFYISMTQDSLYIRICNTKRVQIRRKSAPESVLPTPRNFLLRECWTDDSICQIVQVERLPHLGSNKNETIVRKAVAMLFEMFCQNGNHWHGTL